MKRLQFIIISSLILLNITAFGQKKNNGKIRVIIKNYESIRIEDSCSLKIFKGDELIHHLDISQQINDEQTKQEKIFIDKIVEVEEDNYIGIIESSNKKTIVINNMNLKRKIINWLPIDFEFIYKQKAGLENIIIVDKEKLFNHYELETNEKINGA